MTDSNPTPAERDPFDYEVAEQFADELHQLDPAATLAAQLEHGPSARVSAEYGRDGRRLDGLRLGVQDEWLDDAPEIRPPGPHEIRADDEIWTDRGVLQPHEPQDTAPLLGDDDDQEQP